MARILITTHGSRGDVHPFLALGHGLRARGHMVRFAVAEQWRSLVEGEGFAVAPLPDEPPARNPEYQHFPGVAARAFDIFRPLRASSHATDVAVAHLYARTEALRTACADADLLVASAGQIVASTAADLTSIPWMSVVLTPLVIPTGAFSPIPLPLTLPWPFHSVSHRLSWAIGATVLRVLVDRPLTIMRTRYRLPPRRNLLLTGNLSRCLTAVAMSPALLPRPRDWPSWVAMTGFCLWDAADTWHEPPELTAFFKGATPVIAVSSGSMSPSVAHAFTDFYHTSIAAIRRIGARALVIGAAPGVVPDTGNDVLAVPFAPFSQVYGRCAAAILHGGIGSVAQALRAATPMLVVPWGLDQFCVGQQIADRGVGQWVPRARYTVDYAASMLARLTTQQRFATRARTIADHLAQEDGVAALCERVEHLLRRSEGGNT